MTRKPKSPTTATENVRDGDPKPIAETVGPGRPSAYSETVALQICSGIASGMSLREVCSAETMPDKSTVLRWMLEKDSKFDLFRDQYAQARVIQRELWADETVDISDDGLNDWMLRHDSDGNESGYQLNGEHVQRSRLRVDTRKWFLARLDPKKYGDKQAVEHSGTLTLESLVSQSLAPKG